MNLGFKVQPAPPRPPRVLAAEGQQPCGQQPPDGGGIYCMRPAGHPGGHLSREGGRYWPQDGGTS